MYRTIIKHNLYTILSIPRTIPIIQIQMQKFCTRNNFKKEFKSHSNVDVATLKNIQKRVELLEKDLRKINADLIANTKLDEPPRKYYYKYTGGMW